MWEFITAATKTIFYDNCHWISDLTLEGAPQNSISWVHTVLQMASPAWIIFAVKSPTGYFMKSWFKTKAKTKLIFRSLNQSIWSFITHNTTEYHLLSPCRVLRFFFLNTTNSYFLFIFSAPRDIQRLKMRIRLILANKACLWHSENTATVSTFLVMLPHRIQLSIFYFLVVTSKTKTVSLRLFLK